MPHAQRRHAVLCFTFMSGGWGEALGTLLSEAEKSWINCSIWLGFMQSGA